MGLHSTGAGAEGGSFMTKAELETKIVLLERKIAEQERKTWLLYDALRRIVDLSEDDLPDAELKEAIDHALSVYPLIAGRMRAIVDRAIDSFFHGGQLRELVGMGKEVRR